MKYEKQSEETSTILEFQKGLAVSYVALVDALIKAKVITKYEVVIQLDKYIKLFEGDEDDEDYSEILFSIKATKKMLQMTFPGEESSPETSRSWLANFSGEA